MMTRLLKSKTFFAVMAAFLAFLALYNQPYYPSTWFDEGLVLQGAMNLVKYGKYAMLSVEGFRILDQPLIANGPGIVLPLSAVFSLFGAGLLQARLLAAAFFLAAAGLFFRFSSRLYTPLAAGISLLILLSVPSEGFVVYGRQVLGNVPGLAYFFTGCLLFVRLCERKHVKFAFASGLCFGLALITKGQYWLIVPVWGLVILADLFYYKQMGLKSGMALLGTVILCLALWQLTQYFLVGTENYMAHLDAIRSSSKVTVFAFEPVRFLHGSWYLIRSGFPITIFPALLIGAWESRDRSPAGLTKFFLALFATIWVVWFLVASIGWNRYLFEAYVAGAVFSGYAILKIKDSAPFLRDRFPNLSRSIHLDRLAIGAYLTAVILFTAFGFISQVRNIVRDPDISAFRFADYLESTVSSGEVVESWEWQIDALAPSLTYHHPTNIWVDRKTAEIHFDTPVSESYDALEYNPSYLIDGPFSKFTEMYNADLLNGCCVEVFSSGEYTLYQVLSSR